MLRPVDIQPFYIRIAMDKWVKKKKAVETCGGTGMAKYIDTDEARRLSRLKRIKSSISSKIKHNDWQANRIEKRRRERLRQQKEEAKRKPLGDGIHVDTKVSKVDAMTKCGLKLKLKYVTNKQVSEGVVNKEGGELEEDEVKKTMIEPAILQSASVRRDTFGPITRVVTKASTHPAIRYPMNKQGASTKCPVRIKKEKKAAPPPRMNDDGKENTPDSINSHKDCSAATTIDKKGVVSQTTKTKNVASHDIHTSIKPKSYFMDINSLKREHEDALKILAELGMSEDKSRSLEAEFSVNESEFDQEENSILSEAGSDQEGSEQKELAEKDIVTAVSESFLNMSHLSTSLVHRNSLDGSSYSYDDEDEYAGNSGGNLTPNMNGNRSSTGTGSSLSPKNISRSFEYDEFFGSDNDDDEKEETKE